MVFENGIKGFLIILGCAILVVAAGITVMIKSKYGFNAVKILGILLILMGIGAVVLTKKLCFEDLKLSHNVSTRPLAELKLPHTIKSVKDILKLINTFKSYKIIIENSTRTDNGCKSSNGTIEWIEMVDSKGAHMEIELEIFDSIEGAKQSYDHDYRYYGRERYGLMEEGGEPGNGYFVTYLNQQRASPESLYMLMDMCCSFAAFQKNNMVVRLSETTRKGELSKMNMYIQLLAEKLPQVADAY